jgi:hypothetical protein
MLHDATSTTTGLTGSRYRKESLLITDLARATTVGAVFRLRAVRRAVSLTLFASFKTRDTQLRSHSVVRIFERNLQVVTQIGAALRGRATGASATATKDVVEPKKIPEDIFDAPETRRSPGLSGATGNAGMSKVIVTLPLGGIGKHTVGFRQFFELLFSSRIVLIRIRMMTSRQTAVGALQLLIGSSTVNAQYLVIISFTHLEFPKTSRAIY